MKRSSPGTKPDDPCESCENKPNKEIRNLTQETQFKFIIDHNRGTREKFCNLNQVEITSHITGFRRIIRKRLDPCLVKESKSKSASQNRLRQHAFRNTDYLYKTRCSGFKAHQLKKSKGY